MTYIIGQCCSAVINTPVDGSAKNEVIPFTNEATLSIPWNSTRKTKFGDSAVISVYILGDDAKLRLTQVEISPDVIPNPTAYNIDLGGVNSGEIVIT